MYGTERRQDWGPVMDGMGGMGIWMLISALFGLAILALIVVGVVWLARSLSGSRPGGRAGATPQVRGR
jgi:hypothetical protein